MGLLPDTVKYGLRMRRECRERFPRRLLQRNPLVIDPSMHHGTCVTHVRWFMPGSLTRGAGENAPCIPGACPTGNFTYLARGPWYSGLSKTKRNYQHRLKLSWIWSFTGMSTWQRRYYLTYIRIVTYWVIIHTSWLYVCLIFSRIHKRCFDVFNNFSTQR